MTLTPNQWLGTLVAFGIIVWLIVAPFFQPTAQTTPQPYAFEACKTTPCAMFRVNKAQGGVSYCESKGDSPPACSPWTP